MKALILDAGGVVFNEPVPDLLEEMAQSGNSSLPYLENAYQDIYEDFWSGRMKREDFWAELLSKSGASGDSAFWEQRLLDTIDRGPLYFDLFYWSRECDIFLFSNHLSEWLRPFLSETENFFKDVIISEEIRSAKPSEESFEFLLGRVKNYDDILFVDDRISNIKKADELGIPSIFAEDDVPWRDEIITWLD